MSSALLDAAQFLLVAFSAACGAVAVALLLLRVTRRPLVRRATARRDAPRALLVALLMGEPDEASRAYAALANSRARGTRHIVEDESFRFLGKVRGASADDLRRLLADLGAASRAARLCRSASQVRRCRGAHRLGLLAAPQSRLTIEGLLDDPSLLVRRTAIRALGTLGDPAAAGALLAQVGPDRRLTSDLVHALVQLGEGAVPVLRQRLEEGLLVGPNPPRVAEFSAYVLGKVGSISEVPLLLQALDRDEVILSAASAAALGELGAPEALPGLQVALAHRSPVARAAAATALGQVGSDRAVAALSGAFEDDDRVLSRRVAAALLRAGPAGHAALAANPSPYAAEALAVGRLRGEVQWTS